MQPVLGNSTAEDSASGTIPNEKPYFIGMRILLYTASWLVFIAGFQLFVLTEQTDQFFSWTIKPSLTAAFLGAAYWSSCILEFLAARQKRWAYGRIAAPTALTFTGLTLLVTLLHLDKFHFDPAKFQFVTLFATWAWLAVYVFVPPIFGALLVVQLRQRGGEPPRLFPMPNWIRIILGIQGGTLLVLGILWLAIPETMNPIWPWQLTPLTGRAIGAWLVGMGVAALHSIWENDWQRVQAASASLALFGVLEFVALARYLDTLDFAKPGIWVFGFFLASLLVVGCFGLYKAWQSRK